MLQTQSLFRMPAPASDAHRAAPTAHSLTHRNGRNLLDIYVPEGTQHRHTRGSEKQHETYPVVVFLSGGAWIIGYKCWGALMGKMFSEHGVIFVTPDYRNFPQVHIFAAVVIWWGDAHSFTAQREEGAPPPAADGSLLRNGIGRNRGYSPLTVAVVICCRVGSSTCWKT